MMRIQKHLLILSAVFAAFAFFGTGCSTQTNNKVEAASPLEAVNDVEIESALSLIEKIPQSPGGFNALTVLYIKRARETGDFELNTKARSANGGALAIAPRDASARKLNASLLLTFHKFAEALEAGSELRKEFPSDAFVWGVLTDANTQLGNYEAAVDAAQRMVDLKPNAASFARVAHLRSLHGDHAGAVEMYQLAARSTDPIDKEGQSWTLVQLGDEYMRNGKYDRAEAVYDEALSNFPAYNLALVGKGRARAALNDHQAAVHYFLKARQLTPSTENTLLLAEAFSRVGSSDEARKMYAIAEDGEAALGELHDEHRLALFWADRDTNLGRALDIAQADYDVVKDVYAADILAWCLYKNGRAAEAKLKIKEAMRLKTRDARVWYHAGVIENALGNKMAARKFLADALKLDPSFDKRQAENAREILNRL